MSDLHLEFAGLSNLPGGDVLILAGDILTVRHLRSNKTDADGRLRRKCFEKFCLDEVRKYGRSLYATGNNEPVGPASTRRTISCGSSLQIARPNTRLLAKGGSMSKSADKPQLLLKHHLRQLKLPNMKSKPMNAPRAASIMFVISCGLRSLNSSSANAAWWTGTSGRRSSRR